MNEILATIKFTIIFVLILLYAISSLALELVPMSKWQRRGLRARLIGWYSRFGLRVLGVEVYNFGVLADGQSVDLGADHKNYLHVSNHLSYLDILVLAAQRPCCFVTSVEIRDTFFLGWLCRLGGCLFVERRNKFGLQGEISEISEALENGLNVLIFPEATSTNGDDVLRFRRPLYSAALTSGRLVKPICLFYESINGDVFSLENRDLVCWYGDMGFVSHLFKFCQLGFVMVCVTHFAPLSRTTIEELSEVSHRLVRDEYLKQKTQASAVRLDGRKLYDHWGEVL